jgi:hypothetical protein
MVSRYAGACLGLLAFAVCTIAGVMAGLSLVDVLSRAVRALVLFCLLGLVLGAVAQSVIVDHHRSNASRPPGGDANPAPPRAQAEEVDTVAPPPDIAGRRA